MLTHWFVGVLLFFIARSCGMALTPWPLGDICIGAIVAAFPDVISWCYGFNWTKNSHTHRENWSHSIFWYPIAAVVALPLGWNYCLLIFWTLLTHPLIDGIGLGFGVRIFYGVSNGSFYYQYRGRYWYSQEEIEEIIRKNNDDQWFEHIFLKWFRELFKGWKRKSWLLVLKEALFFQHSQRPWILISELFSILGIIVLIYISLRL